MQSVEPLDDDQGLLLRLDQPLVTMDQLLIEGIRDRAAKPNLMPPTTLDLVPAAWPSDRAGLILMWESGDAPNLVLDEDRGVEESVVLQAHGSARFDHDWALTPSGGRFTASKELQHTMLKQVKIQNMQNGLIFYVSSVS